MDISNIRKQVSEARVYAVLVRSSRGSALHLGIHFSLDDAYATARARMQAMAPHSPTEAIDIELWNVMSARQAVAQFVDPSAGGVDELLKRIQSLPPITQVEQGANTPLSPINYLPKETPSTTPAKPSPQGTLKDSVQSVRESRNVLMKQLITQGDLTLVDKFKEILGPSSSRYVKQAIINKSTPPQGGNPN